MTATKHTHPNDCPDHKAAIADRKQHEAARPERQLRQQALAHTRWLDWYSGRSAPHAKSDT
jgi:hypothetical protein